MPKNKEPDVVEEFEAYGMEICGIDDDFETPVPIILHVKHRGLRLHELSLARIRSFSFRWVEMVVTGSFCVGELLSSILFAMIAIEMTICRELRYFGYREKLRSPQNHCFDVNATMVKIS
jgi:hypothetical protein